MRNKHSFSGGLKMRKLNLNILTGVCVLTMALTGLVSARTIYVDANGSTDFSSIQAVIDDANDYDEIEVAPETYNEDINFNGKAIKVVFASSAKRTCSTSPSHENRQRDAVWASPGTFPACPPTHDHANPRSRNPPSNAKHL
jgi:hypothetical protein